MRIVRLANYVAPASGGLRTALRELGAGYLAAGHEPVLITPGSRPERRHTEQGLVITVPGPRVPGTGGYREITARRPLRRLLDDLEPDRIEVSDRTTLRWTGAWARRRGIRSVMVSHDSLATLVQMFRPPGVPVRGLVDRLNRDTAQSYDVVVCTTAWAGAEFRRLGVPNLVQVPLGVDLACFHPARADEDLRSRLAPGRAWLLVHCSRLSPEKRPERAVGALAELHRRGVPAVLVIAGDGPQRRWLQARAARLPVTFLGHITDRGLLASLLATADVVIAPGPAETFGLSALEALWVVLGDSTAQGLGAPSPMDGYVGQVLAGLRQRTGQRWRVLNLSLSGALIRDVLRDQLPRLPVAPELVTCGIGANDVLYSGPAKLLRDLRALIDTVPDETVLLDLPLPAGIWGILGRASVPYVTRINRTIHQAARARGLPVAEVSAHFMPPWNGKFGSDCFHPSQAGYRDWTRALLTAIPSAA